jgi:excisionase family DNA binding protein
VPQKSIAKPSNVRRWATVQQAAEYISVEPITIRKLISEGKLPGYNGASWRILRVDLNELDKLMGGDAA